MVRKESFSPSDICIWVRFDKYNTINRSCSGRGGGGGGGRGRRKEGREGSQRRGERVRSTNRGRGGGGVRKQ